MVRCGFRPDKPLGLRVVLGNKGSYLTLKFADRTERSETNPFGGDLGEETFEPLSQDELVGVKWT